MGINFPNPGALGEIFNVAPGLSYIWGGAGDTLGWNRAPLVTALRDNKIVNGAMQHSQQNGDTLGVAGNYYPADQWWANASNIAANAKRDGTNAGMRGNVPLYMYNTTAYPTLTTGQIWNWRTRIEGRRVAEFKWGLADAKQAVLRFSAWASVGGQYTVAIRNIAQDYVGLFPFTLPTQVWTDVAIVITPPTAGTWAVDATAGLQIDWNLAASAEYIGVAGWQSGNFRSLPGSVNLASAVNQYFFITDVGLYMDPYKTGVAPDLETPDHQLELRKCQRYWQKVQMVRGWGINSTTLGRGGAQLQVPMRATPAIALIGTVALTDGSNSGSLSVIGATYSNFEAVEFDGTMAGGLSGSRAIGQFADADTNYIAADARL